MNEEKRAIAEDILNCDSISELKEKLNEVNDSEVLHLIMLDYNWDDGFDVPETIMNNRFCTLGTALEMFYLAEGSDYLENKSQSEYAEDIEWINFIKKLYSRIICGRFSNECIEFSPPLTKVQIFKLKKKLKDEEMVFITPIVRA